MKAINKAINEKTPQTWLLSQSINTVVSFRV